MNWNRTVILQVEYTYPTTRFHVQYGFLTVMLQIKIEMYSKGKILTSHPTK